MKKKILMVTLLAVLFVLALALTNTVKATDITITDVTSLSGGTVSSSTEGKVYTLTLTKTDISKLVWHAIDDPTGQAGVDRVANGWDIGFKLTLSSDFTKGQLKAVYTDYEGIVRTNSSCTPDTNASEYSAWVSLNENKLEGQTEVFQLAKFEFEIGTDKATVIVKVDPTDVELKLPEDGSVVKVTVDGYEFTMKKDKTLSANEENGGLSEAEVADLEALMTKEGYKFVGLFIKGTNTKFTLDQVISSDLELEVRFEKIPEKAVEEEPVEEPAEEKPAEKDDTPKMGTIDVALISSVVAMVSVAGIVTVKKYSK